MKPNKLPLFELMIGDEETDEIFAISWVESPAIELDFQYFGKELIQFAEVSKEKRLVMGPILVPNKRIFRVDGEGKEYEVYFKPETVRRLSQMYLEKKYTDSATIEHDTKKIKGINLVESWIVDNKFQDKSKAFGFQVPEGTWMGVFRVDESPEGKNIWDDYVKTGKVKGFSIEGMFEHSLVAAAKVEEQLWNKDIKELDEEEAQILLGKIKAIISKDKRYKGKQRIEMESYSDYGDGIRNNAKRGIELNEKNGNKCATQTGKVRAQQLAGGQPISLETIKRMYSYLSRAAEYYDETDTTACGTISYLLWGGKAALSWSRNKLRELGELVEGESPSFPQGSTYPGEAAKGKKKYKSPALFAEAGCPPATQDVELNLENRQKAIDEAMYGPLDIKNPGDYWETIAEKWDVPVEEAKGEICGNCAAFNVTKKVLNCIAEGIGGEDAWDVVEAGDLGYCEIYKFKCNANRSCFAHIDGGPITD